MNSESGADRRGRTRGGAEHDERPLRVKDHCSGTIQCRRRRDWELDRVRGDRIEIGRLRAGDVFRQFQVHRSGPFLLRHPKRLADQGRDCRSADDLPGHLGQRGHG